MLQVAIKNSVDVFYFATVMPMHIFFTEDGAMEKRVFLSTWKDIPSQNEVQFNIDNVNMNAGVYVLGCLTPSLREGKRTDKETQSGDHVHQKRAVVSV